MLLGLLTEFKGLSVKDIGLGGKTAADGLAVFKASEMVGRTVESLVSGCFTVRDEDLLTTLNLLWETEALKIEPSAAAGFEGLPLLLATEAGNRYMVEHRLDRIPHQICHVVWTTGGQLVPEEEFTKNVKRGKALSTRRRSE
jgi:D-serine dehydratase